MLPTLDVRALAAKNILKGELEFAFPPEEGLLDLPFAAFVGEVRARLGYEIAADGKVYIAGELRYTLEGNCSRCLAPAREEIAAKVEGVFEEGKGDGETYGYHRVVQLGEFLRDSLLFSFPQVLLCDDCRAQED